MKELIKKYALLNLSAKLLVVLISTILILVFPKLLTFDKTTYGLVYLQVPMTYLFNLIIAAFILNDMRKLNIKSIAILILTCLAGVTGTILFLFATFKNNFPKYEK